MLDDGAETHGALPTGACCAMNAKTPRSARSGVKSGAFVRTADLASRESLDNVNSAIETARALGRDDDEAGFHAKAAAPARQKPKAEASERGREQPRNALGRRLS